MPEYISTLRVIGNELHISRDIFYRCAVGVNGFSDNKREGDGCTPIGNFALRECLYRPGRVIVPPTRLPVQPLRVDDGWCDDPKSPDYNRMVQLPYNYSHELLWRRDNIYDIIIPIGYNDDPIVPGKGSAIFLHVARRGYTPTEGCVALALPDLLSLVSRLSPVSRIEIKPE